MFKKFRSQASEVTRGEGAHCQASQPERRPEPHVLEGENGQPSAAL